MRRFPTALVAATALAGMLGVGPAGAATKPRLPGICAVALDAGETLGQQAGAALTAADDLIDAIRAPALTIDAFVAQQQEINVRAQVATAAGQDAGEAFDAFRTAAARCRARTR